MRGRHPFFSQPIPLHCECARRQSPRLAAKATRGSPAYTASSSLTATLRGARVPFRSAGDRRSRLTWPSKARRSAGHHPSAKHAGDVGPLEATGRDCLGPGLYVGPPSVGFQAIKIEKRRHRKQLLALVAVAQPRRQGTARQRPSRTDPSAATRPRSWSQFGRRPTRASLYCASHRRRRSHPAANGGETHFLPELPAHFSPGSAFASMSPIVRSSTPAARRAGIRASSSSWMRSSRR